MVVMRGVESWSGVVWYDMGDIGDEGSFDGMAICNAKHAGRR